MAEPADPAIWIDPNDPAHRRLRKIELDTPVESVLRWGGSLAVLSAVFIVWAGVRGRHAFSLHAPDRWVVLDASLALTLAVVLFALLMLTDNFYVLDVERRRVLEHIKFGPFRRVAPLVDAQDVLAVSTDTRVGSLDYRWYRTSGLFDNRRDLQDQRVVVVTTRGRKVGFTNWTRDALWASNNQARDLAARLGSSYVESPEDQRLVVRYPAGQPTLTFVPLNVWDRFRRNALYLAFFAVLAGASYAVYILSGG